jgi:hypothetical protein
LLKEKIGMLDKIRKENKEVDEDLYMRIKKSLKYEYSVKDEDKLVFLKELPPKIKTDLAYVIHKNDVAKLPFFRNKSKSFIAHVAQLLRPIQIRKGDLIFEEGEPADHIFFILKGKVAYIVNDITDIPFIFFEDGKIFKT